MVRARAWARVASLGGWWPCGGRAVARAALCVLSKNAVVGVVAAGGALRLLAPCLCAAGARRLGCRFLFLFSACAAALPPCGALGGLFSLPPPGGVVPFRPKKIFSRPNRA